MPPTAVCCAGDWDQGKARVAARPGEEDEEGGGGEDGEAAEVYGDFEDLETGEGVLGGVCYAYGMRSMMCLLCMLGQVWQSGACGAPGLCVLKPPSCFCSMWVCGSHATICPYLCPCRRALCGQQRPCHPCRCRRHQGDS